MATTPVPKVKARVAPTPPTEPVEPLKQVRIPKVSKPVVESPPEGHDDEELGEFYNVIHPCSACQFCVRKEDKKNITEVQGVCVWHSVELRMLDMEQVSSEVRQNCLQSGDKFIPRMTRVDPVTFAYWIQGGGTLGARARAKFIRWQTWATGINLILLVWLLIASVIK